MYADMERMFAYGQPKARLWSIGLEEYCSEDELPKRIEIRSRSGEYVSLTSFHLELFEYVPQSVSVWDLTLQIYQQLFGCSTELGGLDPASSDILLAEILPLPRPQHDRWPEIYQQWWPAGLDAYVAHALPRMARRLLDRVRAYRPEVVLLHGKTEHRKWIRALGLAKWDTISLGGGRNDTAHLLKNDGSVWAITNNLVNNGYVTWDDQKITALTDAIRRFTENQ
jgi:hypothetical protein